MNDSQFLSLAWTQLIQVSVLIAVVWLLVKLFARQRPHLAHALWLLVLAKCVTPPVMSSPAGVLGRLAVPPPEWLTLNEQPVEEEPQIPAWEPVDLAPEPDPEPLPDFEVSDANFEVDDLSRGFVIDEDELPPEFFAEVELEEEFLTADEPPPVVEPDVPDERVAAAVPVSSRLWKIWLGSAGFVLLITFARVLVTLRRVYRNRIETSAELQSLVGRLSRRLRLRRKVRILVTAARVGPAVVGFFRPLLILPQVVTQGRSAEELEPIIAHELLHVKRGDLGVGWLQVLVQSLWWFHPLVWLVNRFLSREAERCCDEAVVAELECPPAAYARCLLNVLEQKRNLTPIPACPGVKPVELTKQRMERIMKLGQGCRKRSPWWCWLMVVLLGVVVLPGRGETEAEGNHSTVVFQLKEAAATTVTTEIEKEGIGSTTTDSQELITRTYSIDDVVQRMCNDHGLTEQAAQIHLETLIGSSISSLEMRTQFQGSPSSLTKCIISENTLIVRGTREGHELVKGLLKLWKDVGLYQVKVTTRFASTDVQVSAENVTGKQDANSALTGRLSELEAFRLINTMQSDARTNIFFAPKVTLFNGQQAVVCDEVQRPFVTGMDGDKPVIDFLSEGWKLMIAPSVDADGNIELKYQLRLSAIVDVDTRDLEGRQGKEPSTVQIPDARQVHVRSQAKLHDGETLLISGLKRHSRTQKRDAENFLVMITPKLEKVDLHDLSWESMTIDVSQSQRGDGRQSAVAASGKQPDAWRLVSDGSSGPVTQQITPIQQRLSESEAFLTHAGQPIADSAVLQHVTFDLREQKQHYLSKHKTLVDNLNQPFAASYRNVSLKDALCDINRKTGIIFVVNTDKIAESGLSLDTSVEFQISGVSVGTVLSFLNNKLGYCSMPFVFLDPDGKVSPRVYLSTKSDIIDVSLALRARSIPVICAPDDYDYHKMTPTREKILKALETPIELDFQQTLFTEAASQIANSVSITIYVDGPGLQSQGVNASTKIDFQSDASTTLRQDLTQICEPLGLTFHVEDEVLKITGEGHYQNQIITVGYWLGDLMPPDFQSGANWRQTVIDHVQRTYAPESWKNSKEFKIIPIEGEAAFLVRQRPKVHQQIRELATQRMLDDSTGDVNDFKTTTGGLRLQIPAMGPVPMPAEPARPWIKHTWAWLKHTPPWKKYDREISVSFERTPLKQAIEKICAAGDLKVLFFDNDKDGISQILEVGGYPQVFCDANELAEEGFSLSVPVTFSAKNKAAIPILEEILRPFGLGLGHSRGGQAEYFVIQPKDFLDRRGWTVIYPVGDLLEKDPSLQSGPTQGVPMLDKIPHQDPLFKAKPKTKADLAEVLIEILETALAWDHSEANMATGTMKYRESSDALVICCDRAQHDLIAKLLSMRRKACGIETKPVSIGERNDIVHPPVSKSTRPWAELKHAYPWREISVSFEQTPLKQAIEQICQAGHLEVMFSDSAIEQSSQAGRPKVMCFENELAEEGISLSVPVTYSAENQTPIQVLEDILKPFKLGLELRPEPVNGYLGVRIEIRSKDFLNRAEWTVTYPVGDLLEKDQSLQGVVEVPVPNQANLFKAKLRSKADKAEVLIEPFVKAMGWSDDEAKAAIEFFETTDSLVVRGNRAQHELIAKLLCERRKACGIEINPATSGDQENSKDVSSNNGVDQVDPDVWKLLVQWERAGNDYKKVSSEFRRFVYDAESQVEKRSKGTLFYALPGAWCLEIEPEKIVPGTKSQKFSPKGQRYSVKSDQFGFSICDGTQVAVAQHDKVKIEELQGRDILRQPGESPFAPPVPFFIGLPAEVAGSRYQFTLLPNTNEEHVWLRVLPKRLSDRKNWTSAEVILNRKTFLPLAIKLIDAAGSTETVYKFTEFKVNGRVHGGTLNITKAVNEYIARQRRESVREETSLSPEVGPGPSVMPPVNPRDISTVQLRFLGPKESLLHILVPVLNGPDTNYEIGLPGRQNLPPGKTCSLALGIKALDGKKEAVAFEVFEWTLEIPEWNARSKAYLSRNSVPLQFTDEDLDQVASNNTVTKVVYLPHPDKQELALYEVETLVSTRLDPGIDPVEEAKRRGTILAVLKSRGREVARGGNQENDAENTSKAPASKPRTWNDLRDSRRKAEPPVASESKPGRSRGKDLFVTVSYPVADLVLPISGFENHEKKGGQSGGWGIPVTGTPISIPGPPHTSALQGLPQPEVGGLGPGVLPQSSEVLPGTVRSRHLVQPPQPATGTTPISLSGPPQLPMGTGGIADLATASESKPNVASPLIELLTQTLKAAHGGELADGTKINFVQEQLCLVIRALEKDHDLIAELLNDVRRKQDLQVVIDCRVVQLPKEALNGARFGSITLNTKGVQHVLKFVEDAEEAQIIAAPKLTTLNGIGAQIQISGAAVGKQQVENMHYMIVPTVSEDRRTIDVKLAVNPKNTLDVLSKAKSITIPDGGLVLWEVTDELLSEPKGTGVPEVDKALRELKKKELGVRTFVLLTPRIIIQEEEEALLLGPAEQDGK